MRIVAGITVLAAAMAAGAGSMAAQGHDWVIDKAHSEADFAVTHMAVSRVHGSFHNLSGVIHFDPANPASWAVDATVDVSTVDTGVAQRDTHLKSPDFFEVDKYPTMTFKGSGAKKEGSDYTLRGDLTIHGVTKPVTLTIEAPGKEVNGMDGKSVHRGFIATTTIDRKDFGLGPKFGDAMVGEEVKIELDVEAVEK